MSEVDGILRNWKRILRKFGRDGNTGDLRLGNRICRTTGNE